MYGANFDYGMLRALPSFLNGILLAILFRMSHPYRHKRMIFASIGIVRPLRARPQRLRQAGSRHSAVLLRHPAHRSRRKCLQGVSGAPFVVGRLGNTSYAIYMLHDAVLIAVFKPLWTWLGLRPDQFGLFALGVLCGPDHPRGPHLRLFRESGAALHQPLGQTSVPHPRARRPNRHLRPL